MATKKDDAGARGGATGMVKVTLAADHTHAGRQYKKGDQLEVSPRRAKWLEAAGAIEKRKEG